MEEIIAEKRCTKCSSVKPLDKFVKDAKRKDGRRSWCKSCNSEAANKWNRAHPEECRENSRKWDKAHPEKIRENSRKWAKKHPEERRESNRKWDKAHSEKRRETRRKWQKEHPETGREHSRKRRAKKLNVLGGHFTEEKWRDLLFETGYKCLCCGETEMLLQRDHIIPLGLPHSDEISNIQPLCQSCNSSKHTKAIDYRSLAFISSREN